MPPPPPHLPPPYSGSPSNNSGAPSLFHPSPLTRPPSTSALRKLVHLPNMHSRPLPAPPVPRVDPVVAQVFASRSQFPSRATGTPSIPLSSSSLTSSSISLSIPSFPIPSFPPPPPPSITYSTYSRRAPSLSAAKFRSAFPFSTSKISRTTRKALAWFGEHAARKDSTEATFEDQQKKRRIAESEAAAKATKTWIEEDPRRAVIRAKANEAVKSNIQSLLSRDLTSEECAFALKKCDQICTNGGLDLSVVLQEPLIDGKPPVYWAILNRPSPQSSDAALHALVLSLLNSCQPINETTIDSIRLACMLTSNNVLLQHLFWHFPALSPLSRSDAMLLSSAGGGDIVDVDETQDGTGTFVARVQIRRFRLRMRVSKLVKVEFVTSDRIWTIAFSVGPKNTAIGRSESRWQLSFGLGDHSIPAWVDGDFLVMRRLPSVGSGDNYEPTFSLPLGYQPCKLQPGPESAIKMRLDDGPMRPHILNESLALVDGDGTLHAQFNVRLTQNRQPTLPSHRFEFSDGASLASSAPDFASISTRRSKPSPSVKSKTQGKRNRNATDTEKKVYTSLRRGGR